MRRSCQCHYWSFGVRALWVIVSNESQDLSIWAVRRCEVLLQKFVNVVSHLLKPFLKTAYLGKFPTFPILWYSFHQLFQIVPTRNYHHSFVYRVTCVMSWSVWYREDHRKVTQCWLSMIQTSARSACRLWRHDAGFNPRGNRRRAAPQVSLHHGQRDRQKQADWFLCLLVWRVFTFDRI